MNPERQCEEERLPRHVHDQRDMKDKSLKQRKTKDGQIGKNRESIDDSCVVNNSLGKTVAEAWLLMGRFWLQRRNSHVQNWIVDFRVRGLPRGSMGAEASLEASGSVWTTDGAGGRRRYLYSSPN